MRKLLACALVFFTMNAIADTVIGRTYTIHAPAQRWWERVTRLERPLVVVLHGGLGNSTTIAQQTGFNDLADSEKFIVAYPNGTGGDTFLLRNRRTWNAGDCCETAVSKQVDDVAFISTVIAQVRQDYNVSSAYIVGYSNGAMMAYRFACETSGVVNAMVSVAGVMTVAACPNPVVAKEIHGALDTNVPLAGGLGTGPSGVVYRSTAESIALVVAGGGSVELVVKPEGTHAWPEGGASEAWEFLKGK